jgi:hypothetical protein
MTPCRVLATVLSPPSLRVYQRRIRSEAHPRPRRRLLLDSALTPHRVEQPLSGAGDQTEAGDRSWCGVAPPLPTSEPGACEPAAHRLTVGPAPSPPGGGPSPGGPISAETGTTTPTPSRPVLSAPRDASDAQGRNVAAVAAATADFISGVRRALQAPLALRPGSRSSTPPPLCSLSGAAHALQTSLCTRR